MKTLSNLSYVHRYSSNNRGLLTASTLAGCFYCLATFPSAAVERWTYEDPQRPANTALCPRCGVDSVLPSPPVTLTKKFLAGMHKHWFRRSA